MEGTADVDAHIRRKEEELSQAKEDAKSIHDFMDSHPLLARRRRHMAIELDQQIQALQSEIDNLRAAKLEAANLEAANLKAADAAPTRRVCHDEYFEDMARFLHNSAAHK